MTDLYDLVFSGEIDDSFSKQEVQNNFRTKLGVSEKQLERLFSGNPVPLKKKVPKEIAESMSLKLLKLGAITEIKHDAGIGNVNRTTSPAHEKNKNDPSKNAVLPRVEQVAEQEEQAVPPKVIIYEKQVSEQADSQPQINFVSVAVVWAISIFWIIAGLGFMMAFSPFPDGEVRRGMILGLVLFLIGIFQIWRRSRV